MGIVPQLAFAQIRHRPGRYALLALGVALALALPIIGRASGDIVSTRTLTAAIAALPPGERTLIVSYGGNQNPAKQRANDLFVRNELARLSAAPARRQLLFGELTTTTGSEYYLGAADDLAKSLSLTSGRLPRPCAPTRCEVVLTGAGAEPDLDPALGVVIVGHADRVDSLLLPGTFSPGHQGPLLLAENTDATERLASLALFPRGSGWVAPLDTGRVADLGVSAYTVLSRQVSDELALAGQAFVYNKFN